MVAQLRRSLLCIGFLMGISGAALAQTGTLTGHVNGPDGMGLPGAEIDLNRTDIKGHYKVKTNKKGDWLYMGLPVPGVFDISCMVDGKEMDKVKGVKVGLGDNPPVNFDLAKTAASQQQMQQAMQQAAQTGEVNKDAERGMSKEQRDQFEAAAKKNADAIRKNKALNDAFTTGVDAVKRAGADQDKNQKVTDLQTGVDSLTKASQMDASQVAIWDNLGNAYYQLGNVQTGDDRTKSYDQALASYQKVLELKPDSGAAYNQIGNIYGAEGKIPEATDALTKAAQLDPTMAAKAYFNMGANLVNHGKADQAIPFFQKATQADANYAEAWYQLGSLEMAKGAVDPKSGKQTYPPDTAPALQKYLELQPSGPHAAEATAMLQAMGETVQTKTVVPGAKTAGKKR
jgi:tetratricopeptide (TPR) repeat protein